MERQFHVTASGRTLVTLIPGDGVGPEVVTAAQKVIEAAGARVEWEQRQAGAGVFKQGIASGVPADTIESIRKTRVVLKGPLETPVGFGEKSANVTLRKLFETYGNIRPVREMPGVRTPYTGRGIDLVVVRENVEDLYAGIEHMETPGVSQCLKLISRKGCEKIVRLAFEFAISEGRAKVHCATKANIMKLTEGTLKRTFEEVAKEYPGIEAQHIIVDNCAHQLVKKPEQFDVIVTTNMNGDILSDLSSALIGGLGFAPSANIGNEVAIFEAVHGSAPKYAGKNVINPTAVIMSAALMLRHIDEMQAAVAVENAVLATLEAGVLTRDVVGDTGAASTTAFTDAIIRNIGGRPKSYAVRQYKPLKLPVVSRDPDFVKVKARRTLGVDVFLESTLPAEELGSSVAGLLAGSPVELKMISSRGTKIFPPTGAMTDSVDLATCRIVAREKSGDLSDAQLADVLGRIASKHRWMHVEKLNEFDGAAGYTRAQGED
jgi:isocitrate dehydrogenase